MLSISLSFLCLDAFLLNALWIWNKFLDGREMAKTKPISVEKTKESLNEISNQFFLPLSWFWIFPMDNFQSIELMRSLMFSFILLNRKQWHTQYDKLQWNLVKCPLLFFYLFRMTDNQTSAHTHSINAKIHRRTHEVEKKNNNNRMQSIRSSFDIIYCLWTKYSTNNVCRIVNLSVVSCLWIFALRNKQHLYFVLSFPSVCWTWTN